MTVITNISQFPLDHCLVCQSNNLILSTTSRFVCPGKHKIKHAIDFESTIAYHNSHYIRRPDYAIIRLTNFKIFFTFFLSKMSVSLHDHNHEEIVGLQLPSDIFELSDFRDLPSVENKIRKLLNFL